MKGRKRKNRKLLSSTASGKLNLEALSGVSAASSDSPSAKPTICTRVQIQLNMIDDLIGQILKITRPESGLSHTLLVSSFDSVALIPTSRSHQRNKKPSERHYRIKFDKNGRPHWCHRHNLGRCKFAVQYMQDHQRHYRELQTCAQRIRRSGSRTERSSKHTKFLANFPAKYE